MVSEDVSEDVVNDTGRCARRALWSFVGAGGFWDVDCRPGLGSNGGPSFRTVLAVGPGAQSEMSTFRQANAISSLLKGKGANRRKATPSSRTLRHMPVLQRHVEVGLLELLGGGEVWPERAPSIGPATESWQQPCARGADRGAFQSNFSTMCGKRTNDVRCPRISIRWSSVGFHSPIPVIYARGTLCQSKLIY